MLTKKQTRKPNKLNFSKLKPKYVRVILGDLIIIIIIIIITIIITKVIIKFFLSVLAKNIGLLQADTKIHKTQGNAKAK
jgi:hypothetical protein